MKIKSIRLNNIGSYKGSNNTLFLDTDKYKNVVLVGGKNGSGKTTLLNSIKIGLFGPYAFGLKTDATLYYRSLRQLFNYIEARKKESSYSIEITFELVENYITNEYVFLRSWKKKGDDIVEDLRATKNGVILQPEDIELIQTKLKEIMPPAVIDTMLFDGEKIAKIIEDDEIAGFLKDIISVSFNINVFDKMEEDVNLYIEKEKTRNVFSTDQIKIIELKKEYEESKKRIKTLVDIGEKYKKALENERFKLKNLVKRFKNYGGITEEQKDLTYKLLEDFENRRKNNLAIIKNFLEEDVVFYLNKEMINSINKRISKEKPVILLKYTDEIEEYLKSGATKKIREELQNIVVGEDFEIRLNASSRLADQIRDLQKKFEDSPMEKIKLALASTREDLKGTRELKTVIDNNENANSMDFQKLLREIKASKILVEDLENKLIENEKEKKKADNESNIALVKLETLEAKMDGSIKEENSFDVARRILNVAEEFRKKQIAKCLTDISFLATKKFNEITEKNEYVSKVLIKPESYDVVILDRDGVEKNIQLLSAGEKQLMVSAIVWSVVKLADRNMIFTFDTPLARLDKDNRLLFVEKILSTISDQVLILSTDEEIVGPVLAKLSERISEKYLLVYNEKTGRTKIEKGYFK